jgi:hypothetical protein
MPAATTRKSQTRKPAFRRPMNARSLQMMVSSGVVRRADCNPTLVPNRREVPLPTVTGKVQSQDTSRVQGWLARLLVRRKSTASL